MPINKNAKSKRNDLVTQLGKLYVEKKYKDILEIYNRRLNNNSLTPDIIFFAIESCLLIKNTEEIKKNYNASMQAYIKIMEIYKNALASNKVNIEIFKAVISANEHSFYPNKILEIYNDALVHNNVNSDIFSSAISASNILCQYKQTIEIYKKAIKTNKLTDCDTLFKVIEACYKAGDYKEAIVIYDKMDPVTKYANSNIYIVCQYIFYSYSKSGQYDKLSKVLEDKNIVELSEKNEQLKNLIIYFKRLIEYNNDLQTNIKNKTVTSNIIEDYYILGDIDKAISSFNKAIKQDKNNLSDKKILDYAMKSYCDKGDYAKVLELYETASNNKIVDSEILVNVLRVKYEQKKYQESISLFKANNDILKNSDKALLYIIKAFYNIGAYATIVSLYDNNTNSYFNEDNYLEFAEYGLKALNKCGSFHNVSDIYERKNFSNPKIIAETIFAYNKLEEYEKARQLYQELFLFSRNDNNQNNEAILNSIETYYRLNDYTSCIESYNLYTSLNNAKDKKVNAAALKYLLLANYKLKNYKETFKIYNKYFINIDDYDIFNALINIYYDLGEHKNVIEIAQKLLRYGCSYEEILANVLIMRSNYELGNFEEAKIIYDEIKNDNVNNIALDGMNINVRLKNYEEVLNLYKKLPQKDQNSYEALYNMVKCYCELSDYNNAKIYYEKIKNIKKPSDIYIYAIKIYDNLKKYDKIINIYNSSLSNEEKEDNNIFNIFIKAHYKTNKYSEILKLYDSKKDKQGINNESYRYIIDSAKKVRSNQQLINICNAITNNRKFNSNEILLLEDILSVNFELNNYDNIITIYNQNKNLILNNKNSIEYILKSYYETKQYNDLLEFYKINKDIINKKKIDCINYIITANFALENYKEVINLYIENNSKFLKNKTFLNYIMNSYYQLEDYAGFLNFCIKNKNYINNKIDINNINHLNNILLNKNKLAIDSVFNKSSEGIKDLLSIFTNIVEQLDAKDNSNNNIFYETFINNYNFKNYYGIVKMYEIFKNSNKLNKDITAKTTELANESKDYQKIIQIYKENLQNNNLDYIKVVDFITNAIKNSSDTNIKNDILELYNNIVDSNSLNEDIFINILNTFLDINEYDEVIKLTNKKINFNREQFMNTAEGEYVYINEKQNPTSEISKNNNANIAEIIKKAYELKKHYEIDLVKSIKENYNNNNYNEILLNYKEAMEKEIFNEDIFCYAIKAIKKFDNDNKKILNIYNKAIETDKINPDIISEVMESCLEKEEYTCLEKVFEYSFKSMNINEKIFQIMIDYFKDSYQREKYSKMCKLAETLEYKIDKEAQTYINNNIEEYDIEESNTSILSI